MTTGTGVHTRAWVEHIMGMPISVHVRAHDPDRTELAAAVSTVFDRVRHADAVFSTWRSDSELMRLRRGELDLVDADPRMTDVAQLCDAATEATSGLFTTDLVAPDGTRGWDPTGLVKGWAVDQAADVLRTVDRIAFSINAGGDIVCGLGEDSQRIAHPWRIGIENPADRSVIAHVEPIVEGAIATSGSAARGAHIIDPRTGNPVTRSGSTTVIGPRLVWADIWATTSFIEPTALHAHTSWRDYHLLISE
jgi:thiamine biosynthesis lipoprotein